MKIGLEQEFFIISETGEPVLVPSSSLPFDGCGWLVEARGKPMDNVIDAIFSLQAECYRITEILSKVNKNIGRQLTLVSEPLMKVSKNVREQASRRYAKELIKWQNFYGYTNHKVKEPFSTAGIHVSFTVPMTRAVSENETFTINANFDWPKIFTKMDKFFKDEILAAKRLPGFYEVKPDGRVEYRSLPNNIPYPVLIEKIQLALA